MKKISGIIMFVIITALAFYIHFNKLANGISQTVKIKKVESGKVEKILSSENCSILIRNLANFVEIHGKIDSVKKTKGLYIIKTGCLNVLIYVKNLKAEAGKAIKVKGFLRKKENTLYIKVYNPENIIISD